MCCRETMGGTEVYHRDSHMHGPLSNSTLLCNCRNHSNIQVFNNLALHMQVLLSEVLTHCSTHFAYGEIVVHEYQSSQETQKDCQDKETSDEKQQDLCLHNEEDISELQDGTNSYTPSGRFQSAYKFCPKSKYLYFDQRYRKKQQHSN